MFRRADFRCSKTAPLRPVAAAILALALLPAGAASAQQNQDIVGSYSGVIGNLESTLRLRLRPDGTMVATIDHLDLRAPWMLRGAEVHRQGSTLTFTVPSVRASFRGDFSADQKQLAGTWTQEGRSFLVTFVRETFIPAAKPSPLDGIWLGTPQIGGNTPSRTQIVFRSDANGREYCTVDGLDIDYMDMECANVVFQGDTVSFDVPVMALHWVGKLESGGNALNGDVHQKMIQGGSTQDLSTALNLTRQKALALEKPLPRATFDPALPPISATDIESVLAKDLAGALKSGELAPSGGEGVAIGVYSHGVSRVFSFGAARPDSIFEIGTLTRPFTALLLAQMAAQHQVRLDEPVRDLLPAGAVARPEGREIVLLDLATQQSGLPSMPDNISVANMDQPYADYHVADLLAYVGKHGVANPAHAASTFSSLGYCLLGTALAMRAGDPYTQLVQKEITVPLGMSDTVFALSPGQQARFLPGEDEFRHPARPWNSDVFAPVLGLRSTAQDLLTFLVANLHPDQLRLNSNDPFSATLPFAIRQSHQTQAQLSSGMDVAMGWLYDGETGNYWHTGATAAHSAYAFFNPKEDFAAVVLLNISPGLKGWFVERLGHHIYQRLAGQPVISLDP